MKLCIMQPYFFPHLGYFKLIYRADEWVMFDTPQYIRHGWINRNRILHPMSGWQYITVPLEKHHRETAIRDIRISFAIDWRTRIMGQLRHYKKQAPLFGAVTALVNDSLAVEETSLARLNARALDAVCRYLSIPFRTSAFSEMNLALGHVDGPGDWALRISEAMGATEYINLPGGVGLFDLAKYEQAGVRLTIQKPVDFRYACGKYTFEPGLSIIDVLMWNTPEKVKAILAA